MYIPCLYCIYVVYILTVVVLQIHHVCQTEHYLYACVGDQLDDTETWKRGAKVCIKCLEEAAEGLGLNFTPGASNEEGMKTKSALVNALKLASPSASAAQRPQPPPPTPTTPPSTPTPVQKIQGCRFCDRLGTPASFAKNAPNLWTGVPLREVRHGAELLTTWCTECVSKSNPIIHWKRRDAHFVRDPPSETELARSVNRCSNANKVQNIKGCRFCPREGTPASFAQSAPPVWDGVEVRDEAVTTWCTMCVSTHIIVRSEALTGGGFVTACQSPIKSVHF